jgi:hypothetical protein
VVTKLKYVMNPEERLASWLTLLMVLVVLTLLNIILSI